MLEDQQGAGFASGVIFEGLAEIKGKFNGYAEQEEYGSDVKNTWTIGDCLEHWQFTLYTYDGGKWVEVEGSTELSFIK